MSTLAPKPDSLKQGDTIPLVATLSDAGGPINLEGTSVRMRMVSRVEGSGHPPILGNCEILQYTDETTGRVKQRGQVQYRWGPGETDEVGVYGIDWQVTFTDGTTRSFPNASTVVLEIEVDPTFARAQVAQYDLLLVEGDSDEWQFKLWDDPDRSDATNLDGATAQGQIRDVPGGSVVMTLACTVVLPNVLDVKLPAAEWAHWPAGRAHGVWDLQVSYPSGDVNTVLAGQVQVSPQVTV